LLLAFVMLIPGVLNQIPLSALAAILIFVGYKLAKISLFREFWSRGYPQFIPFVVTILAILFTDLLIGVLIGIAISILFMVWSNFHNSVMVVNDNKRNYLLRLRKNVNFLNKPLLKRELDLIPENAKLIIDVTFTDFIDMDVIDTINEYLIRAKDRNIQVSIIKSEFKQLHTFLQEPAVITVPSTS
jgi:MFS superfamily sulfate permease-like transporter